MLKKLLKLFFLLGHVNIGVCPGLLYETSRLTTPEIGTFGKADSYSTSLGTLWSQKRVGLLQVVRG
jgi:hypothetical protein